MPKRNRKPVGDPATKARLAKRAYDLFAQRGYFRVTVADIVRSGGVARGTFYIYWRSKQDCFEDLVDQLVDQLYAEATVRDPARDTRERIAVANRRYLEVFRAHAGILATLYQVATFNPRIGQRQAEVRRRFLARIQRHIERNVAEGLDRRPHRSCGGRGVLGSDGGLVCVPLGRQTGVSGAGPGQGRRHDDHDLVSRALLRGPRHGFTIGR